jgi:hypothetical protein
MCTFCGWKAFAREARDLLADMEDPPPGGEDYFQSVQEKVEGMLEWAEEKEHVTDKMETALENMARGIHAWLERRR